MTTGQAGDATAAMNTPAGAARWDGVRMPPPEIRDRLNLLRDEVHTTLHGEFSTTAGDLDQLRGILSDAAEKLSAAFCEMARGSVELVRLVDTMPDAPGALPLIEVATIAREISSKTDSTVQNLQFEDMACQLLQHVGRRLATLERFSKDMAILYPRPDGLMAPLTDETLDELFRRLEGHRTELLAVGRKTVQQQSLDSGGIELF